MFRLNLILDGKLRLNLILHGKHNICVVQFYMYNFIFVYNYKSMCLALSENNYSSPFLVFQVLCRVGADTSGAVQGLNHNSFVLIYFPIIRCDKEWFMSTY